MNDIKLNQIWQEKVDDFAFNKTFIKINKIEHTFIEGVVISDDLAGVYSSVGRIYNYNYTYFLGNFKLIQDRIGIKCSTCNMFYNETIDNKISVNCCDVICNEIKFDKYFTCWKCQINEKF